MKGTNYHGDWQVSPETRNGNWRALFFVSWLGSRVLGGSVESFVATVCLRCRAILVACSSGLSLGFRGLFMMLSLCGFMSVMFQCFVTNGF